MSYASMTNLKDYLGISVATTEDDPLLTDLLKIGRASCRERV